MTSWKGNYAAKAVCVVGSDSVAAAQADRQSVQFFSVGDHTQQRALVAETLSVLAASADGQYLAGGASSGTIYLWEVSSGCLLRVWPAHYKGVTALLFVGGVSLLLSGGEDTLVHAWLLPDLLDPSLDLDRAAPATAHPKALHSWADHTLHVSALVAGVGEATAVVASASLDRTVKLRRLADGCLLRSLALPAAINDIALDLGEEALYAAGADGVVYVVPLGADTAGSSGSGVDAGSVASGVRGLAASDAPEGRGYWVLVGHSRPVTCLALVSLEPGLGGNRAESQHKSGDLLLSGSEDGSVRVWDLHSRQAVQVINTAGKAPVKSIRSLPSLALGGVTRRAVPSSSGRGVQPHAPLSKYAGVPGHGKCWRGAAVLVDGSEELPREGLLRPAAQLGVQGPFALELLSAERLAPSGPAAAASVAESAERAWMAVLSGM